MPRRLWHVGLTLLEVAFQMVSLWLFGFAFGIISPDGSIPLDQLSSMRLTAWIEGVAVFFLAALLVGIEQAWRRDH